MPREHQRAHRKTAAAERSLPARILGAWSGLDGEQRLAGGAAVALFVTMLLPWYQQNAVVSAAHTAPLQSRNLNAFQAFSFIEAAVLLVAVAVVYLLYARAEGRDFQLPGSDGAVVMAAGLWTALLLVIRLFDKPGITTHGIAANVGVQWGIFFALAAAGLLAYSGSRMRIATRTESPPTPRRTRTHRQPSSEDATVAMPPPKPTSTEPTTAAARSRYPPSPQKPGRATRPAPGEAERTEQLSFDDQPAEDADERDS